MDKKQIIIAIIIVSSLLIVASLIDTKTKTTGKVTTVQITPLSSVEKEKVENFLLTSEFVKDMPESGAFSLRFYTFENGNRIWQDGFLIGKGKEADFGIIIHSKYISEFNENNICEIIKKAKQNGDFGSETYKNRAGLLLKYASMLKYRECFGF